MEDILLAGLERQMAAGGGRPESGSENRCLRVGKEGGMATENQPLRAGHVN